MIPTKNFFNVCRTAIEKCRWLGQDAKRVHLALKELERLQEFASQEREKALPTGEHNPNAGELEYVKETPEDPLDVEDDILDVEDEAEEETY